MTVPPPSPEHPALDPAQFAVLRAFFRGYLHQDVHLVHGSAVAAAAAFVRDANAGERDALVAEWSRFAVLLADLPLTAVREAFRFLGAAWEPATAEDVRDLSRAIRG
jgi:hypothetical protein